MELEKEPNHEEDKQDVATVALPSSLPKLTTSVTMQARKKS